MAKPNVSAADAACKSTRSAHPILFFIQLIRRLQWCLAQEAHLANCSGSDPATDRIISRVEQAWTACARAAQGLADRPVDTALGMKLARAARLIDTAIATRDHVRAAAMLRVCINEAQRLEDLCSEEPASVRQSLRRLTISLTRLAWLEDMDAVPIDLPGPVPLQPAHPMFFPAPQNVDDNRHPILQL
jgi:hypothetical protein